MLTRRQDQTYEGIDATHSNVTLSERLLAFSRKLKDVMQSPLAQRAIVIARSELNRIERSPSLTPNQAQLLSMKITQALSQLAAAFIQSRRPLDWLLHRDADAVRLEMA